jgi:hypothetical protein
VAIAEVTEVSSPKVVKLIQENEFTQNFFCEKLTLNSFIFILKKPFLRCLIVRVSDNKFIVRCRIKNTTSAIAIAHKHENLGAIRVLKNLSAVLFILAISFAPTLREACG